MRAVELVVGTHQGIAFDVGEVELDRVHEGVDAHFSATGPTLELGEPMPHGVVDGSGLREPGEFGQATHPRMNLFVLDVEADGRGLPRNSTLLFSI